MSGSNSPGISIALPDASLLQSLKQQDWEQAKSSYFTDRSVSQMLLDYNQGVGKYDDWTRFKIRQKIDKEAVQIGIIAESETVFDKYGRLQLQYERFTGGSPCRTQYDLVPNGVINNHILLKRSVNEQSNLVLPPAINMVAKLQTRPEVRIYYASGCELYAHPFCYQLFWRNENWFCPSASNRALSKTALLHEIDISEKCETERTVIVIQDRFPGSNFSHFLFDWATRIGLICESGFVEIKNCLFILGGSPGRFETLIIQALLKEYGLSVDQFLFPKTGVSVKTTKEVLWFSDQSETYLHPAQMAHPNSVAVIRKIAAGLRHDISSRFSRIYISRCDAGRRRLANETGITRSLEKIGFEPIVLSDQSIDNQLSAIAGAEHIVAPHGMGITLLSLHPGSPTLVELHHPSKGTDAYALMATAMAFSYQSVVGHPASGDKDDFTIAPDDLFAALERLHVSSDRLPKSPCSTRSTLELQLGMPAGAQRFSESDTAKDSLPEPLYLDPAPIARHVRADPQLVPDSNVGAWTNIRLDAGRLYTAICFIWIPKDFRGSSVDVHIGEWPKQRRRGAAIELREQWQLITASATCPVGAGSCNVVLRLTSPKGEYFFSTGWSIQAGLGPIGCAL